MSISLTLEQEQAYKALLDFILGPKSIFVLEGYAGTGKTTILSKLAKEVSLYLTATTNKAVQVLKTATDQQASTIHNFLGLKPYRNKLQQRKVSIPKRAIVVIDESSLVDDELLGFIQKAISEFSLKVIFVGDRTQLPPVSMAYSPVFFLEDVPTFHLHTIMRQAVSPLQQLVVGLREAVEGGAFPELKPNGSDILALNKDDFETMLHQSMLSPDWDGQTSKFISWTNKRAVTVNQDITILKTSTPLFQVGDLVTNNRYVHNDSTSIATDAMVLIEDVKHDEEDHGYMGSRIWIDGYPFFYPYEPNAVTTFSDLCMKVNDWDTYHYISSNWIDLRHSYGITVHKSQGHTFNDVFIDLADIRKAKHPYPNLYKRLLYVATSRAKNRVIFKV